MVCVFDGGLGGYVYRIEADLDARCYPASTGSGSSAGMLKRTDFSGPGPNVVGGSLVSVPINLTTCSGGVGTYTVPDTNLWLWTGYQTLSQWETTIPANSVVVKFYCSGYTPAVMMGMAPPPQLAAEPQAPTSRFAVVTLAVGQKGRDLLAVSGPLMEAAAKRWGADFRVIAGDDTPFNIGEKLRLHDYLLAYDRVFYADADALILPTAPDPFETFPTGSAYLLDELPHHAAQGRPMGWVEVESAAVAASQGWPPPAPLAVYYNAGVMLLDRAHAAAVGPPDEPYPVWHCSEQNLANLRFAQLGIPVVDWGLAWNYEWWIDPAMRPADGSTPHVLHFSGMDPLAGTDPAAHARRLALMRTFATRKLPLECVNLGRREEFRAGCGGAFCNHHCKKGLPAVPAGFCQTCPDYESPAD